MSKELLSEIIQQTEKLSLFEKEFLANHLIEQLHDSKEVSHKTPNNESTINNEIAKRKQHIQWVKDHQEEYAGKYVALDGYTLIAVGDSFAQVQQAAKQLGISKAFITQIFAPNSVVFGGW
ncbi:MAG: hypothetical protein JNM06_04675 [Blastocatellia bacterium]|nr:hypothetical protein [Blastocatellia bacterium]